MSRSNSYIVGLMGEGIRESLTPPMHEREAALLGFDYSYRIHDLLDLDKPLDIGSFLSAAVADGHAALNITHPFKRAVIPYLDELSTDARELDAVNLILIRNGRWLGENTDWTGFTYAIRAELADAPLRNIVQLGAGGAGAATAYAILKLGAKSLTVADLDAGRARALAASYSQLFPLQLVTAMELDARLNPALATADGVIHATPTGMAHRPGVAFDVSVLRSSAWVADVVYRPLETELIRVASARGLRVLSGGLMAVGQAADSIRLVTGTEPDLGRMREHFFQLIEQEQIVADKARGSQ